MSDGAVSGQDPEQLQKMTLTETAKLTKRGFILLVAIILLSTLGWLGYQYYYYNIYLPSLPKVEIKPDNKFGILPKIVFGQSSATISASPTQLKYSLDTPTGNLPTNLPKIVKVYFIPQLGTTLLAPDRARALANGFSFNNGPEFISQTQYRFTDDNNGEFLIDLNTGNFKYAHRLIATDSAQFQALGPNPLVDTLGDQISMAQDFRNFLSSKNLIKEQLSNGKIKVIYEKGTAKLSDNARVSMWQNDVDQIPIVTTKFDAGLVSALVTKFQDESQKFLILDYTYWPIDFNNLSTYSIKGIDLAYNELKSGQGTILISPPKNQVSITNIYLAYLLGEDYNAFLQPVYVFEGPQFGAVVPAITSDFIAK